MSRKWTPKGYFRLFIAHISKHRKFARNVKTHLGEFGIAGFVAHADIEPTVEWQQTIESALRQMDALLALLHPGFHESRWCDQEVGVAMGRKKLVIPVRIGADPHGFIGKFQAISYTLQGERALADKIAQVLSTNETTQIAMAKGAVHCLQQSESYDGAANTMTLIESIGKADEETIDLLESAAVGNSQVEDGDYGRMPGRIRAQVKQWRRALMF